MLLEDNDVWFGFVLKFVPVFLISFFLNKCDFLINVIFFNLSNVMKMKKKKSQTPTYKKWKYVFQPLLFFFFFFQIGC